MKISEMSNVESDYHTAFDQCPLKLGFVGLPSATNLRCGANINTRTTQCNSNGTVDIFVREKTDSSHQVEPPAIVRALTNVSSSDAKLASISSKWS